MMKEMKTLPKSIFSSCSKCKQTILKSEKDSHKCKPKIILKQEKQINYNLSQSTFDSYNAIYSELGKIISYRIMPNCKHETLVSVLEQLAKDVSANKDRTLDEEIFKVLDRAQKPMTGQAITFEINSMFGFPIRKVSDVNITLSGNRKVFESDRYSTQWYLKNWEMKV